MTLQWRAQRMAGTLGAILQTKELAKQYGDVLVAAIGRPKLIIAEHVREGTVVIDVGITPDGHGKLVGDVDSRSVERVAGLLSPVPGDVGPVMTAVLPRNTVAAAQRERETM
jgi:methylenetetrahydrofolate dehydrogenase (NADP+)/methenyltetrahydrofolate cyclohydrolase